MKSTQADRELISRLEGFYTGSLSEQERDSLSRCIEDGFARKSYENLMGLSQIRLCDYRVFA